MGLLHLGKADGKWSKPELIVSQFAAEPSLDNTGNLYFTHHFFKDGKMIEADIYVAYRKQAILLIYLPISPLEASARQAP